MPAPLVLHRVESAAQPLRLVRRRTEPFSLEAKAEGLAEKHAQLGRERRDFDPEGFELEAPEGVRHRGFEEVSLVRQHAVEEQEMT